MEVVRGSEKVIFWSGWKYCIKKRQTYESHWTPLFLPPLSSPPLSLPPPLFPPSLSLSVGLGVIKRLNHRAVDRCDVNSVRSKRGGVRERRRRRNGATGGVKLSDSASNRTSELNSLRRRRLASRDSRWRHEIDFQTTSAAGRHLVSSHRQNRLAVGFRISDKSRARLVKEFELECACCHSSTST